VRILTQSHLGYPALEKEQGMRLIHVILGIAITEFIHLMIRQGVWEVPEQAKSQFSAYLVTIQTLNAIGLQVLQMVLMIIMQGVVGRLILLFPMILVRTGSYPTTM